MPTSFWDGSEKQNLVRSNLILQEKSDARLYSPEFLCTHWNNHRSTLATPKVKSGYESCKFPFVISEQNLHLFFSISVRFEVLTSASTKIADVLWVVTPRSLV